MSTTPALTYRPTASLVRAVLLGAGAAVLALLTGRPEVAVLAAPFLVWSALGLVRRPHLGEDAPTLSASARQIGAGEAVAVTVTSPAADRVVDLALSPDAPIDLDPPWGAVCTADVATVVVRPRRWGRIDLDDARVRVVDSWGMWHASRRAPIPSVDVRPTATVPGRGDAIPHPIGTAGIHPSRRAGDGSALADIRRFQSGDRLTRVNWRVTSRTGELHTNATTADRDTDVLIVLDTLADATTAEVGGTFASSLDATVLAGASLAEHYVRLGDRVALHDLGAMIAPLPARGGIRQFAALTTRLGAVRLDRPRDRTLRPVGRLRPGTFAVVCSPLLDATVFGEIATLSRRGAAVIVVDTLPDRLGRLEPHGRGALRRLLGGTSSNDLWEEAWVLRRLERESSVSGLRDAGIPVAAWAGVGGIASLAAVLAAQRPGTRMHRGSAT